jgi:hypothetical protein
MPVKDLLCLLTAPISQGRTHLLGGKREKKTGFPFLCPQHYENIV